MANSENKILPTRKAYIIKQQFKKKPHQNNRIEESKVQMIEKTNKQKRQKQ